MVTPPLDRLARFAAEKVSLSVAGSVSAMLAYWDQNQTCHFANDAYFSWFGRKPSELLGVSMRSLLGPLYVLNEPHIRRALAGEPQVFERSIPRPDGSGVRDSLASYTPDISDGQVKGIFVHVADCTLLKENERRLRLALEERDQALARLHSLEGMLSICASCKRIHDDDDEWVEVERYLGERSKATFSHGICPVCIKRLYPELTPK